MSLILLTLIVLKLYLLFAFLRYKWKYDLINKIPGPRAYPIIGNFLMLNVSAEKLWSLMRQINEQHYPITRYWLGPIPHISIYHPDDLEIVLSSPKHAEKGFSYRCLRPWLKTGVLTSNGHKWQQRRKILTPAFHFTILKKYLDVVDNNARTFVKRLSDINKQIPVDLTSLLTNCSLNIICESIVDVKLDEIHTSRAEEYKNAISTMGEVIVYRTFRPFIQDWMLNDFTNIGRMQKNALKILHKFTDKVLNERKRYHDDSGNMYLHNIANKISSMSSDQLWAGNKKTLALLDLLIIAEKDGLIDNDGIKEELDTFIFAGHETTAMALVYTIILLAENPEIQDKARSEIRHVFNKTNGKLEASEVQELHHLERCIKESLRLFPIAPAITRRLSEDIILRGYVIPAGTEIGCYIFDVHRDPNFWPEPTKYDPDRFLPEHIKKRHPYSYIPFSAGPRNCIGQKFAIMSLKCLLAHILHSFELEPVTRSSDIKLVLDMISRTSKPVYAKFVKIDNY